MKELDTDSYCHEPLGCATMGSFGLLIFYLLCGLTTCAPGRQGNLPIWFLGFIAGGFGIWNIAKANASPAGRLGSWMIWSIATALGLLAIFSPGDTGRRDLHWINHCGDQMYQLGEGMRLYANQHGGHFPPNLKSLATFMSQSGHSFPEVAECFVCPATKDAPATDIDDLINDHHLSYIYMGGHLTTDSSADAVLLYEPITNHESSGANFLFADGHVDFDGKARAEKMIRELQAGENPPP